MTTTRLVFASRHAGRRLLPVVGSRVTPIIGAAALSSADHVVVPIISGRSTTPISTHRTFATNHSCQSNNYYKLDNNNNSRYLSSAALEDHDSDHDSSNNNPIIPFKLADIGEGIKEVEILQWFVQKGDTVQQFDRICEVQSDKATVEITSRYDGLVTELAGGNVGDMVQVGDALLHIQVEGGNASTSSDAATAKSSTAATPEEKLHSHDTADQQLRIPHVASQFHLESDDAATKTTATQSQPPLLTTTITSGKKVLATPAVRKLGMEYNLDLSTLVGTGPQGRVLKADVLTFLRESGRMDGPASSSVDPTSAPTVTTPSLSSTPTALLEDEVITLKGYHRLMIQTMTKSQEIPHMGYTDEFNVTKLIDYRKDINAAHSSSDDKISILAFFLKATSLALLEYPIVNASWQDDVSTAKVTLWKNHNIGVAMDTPRGLVVPVVRHCQEKSLVQIQHDLNVLKEIAAAGKLGEEHLTGATISMSNIGSVGGGTYMNPLIVPPQAAIGAMGALQTLPRFDAEGNVEAAKIINMSWAGDHRMMDGATLARFSNRCKEYLQDPVRMLVSMK
ncbi:Lipoamide acyltransferase component of branched-chain alpha-keto acid dehydrogenase [Seminavis robusta]|uniref:Dihydrolipoamide acetyltransferase component of pyruvate dehydrogenase complex n=1 Tax=Seminavis robusta TaxID=568900 RepID=A0A9N8DST5_9STRA|nr:Lipoamide acyltransferase component of branched-chain alpha-keto acid dehydrogenase [Seminavis robusta]|eukprot:Sro327_g118450.1 Lipoamide acyltransferase component of branched-chain alpha-keto acid dehydrogenase (565) ;mRNA; f:60801-62495